MRGERFTAGEIDTASSSHRSPAEEDRKLVVHFPKRDTIYVEGDASLGDLLLLRAYLEKKIALLSEEEFESGERRML